MKEMTERSYSHTQAKKSIIIRKDPPHYKLMEAFKTLFETIEDFMEFKWNLNTVNIRGVIPLVLAPGGELSVM